MKNNNLLKNDSDLNVTQEDKKIRRKDEPSEKIPNINLLFDQIEKGRLRSLQESVNNGFEMNFTNRNGDTPLMIAIQHKQRKIIDFLIHKGANVNHVNNNGNSALHFALAHDKTGQIAEYLVEKGANDSIKNNFGKNPYEDSYLDN